MGTILSRIHQIELTNRCNLNCVYCANHLQLREKSFMNLQTFSRTLDIASRLNQKEIWLHGLGESLLHPQFTLFCRLARKYLPKTKIQVSTNAMLMTEDIADVLAELNIRVHVSIHLNVPDQEALAKVPRMLQSRGILDYIACNPVISANDWAGKVNWPVDKVGATCGWIGLGWMMVLVDGRISACCVDADGECIHGSVFHPIEDIIELQTRRFALCANCVDDPEKFK